jgi:glycosidase
MHPRIRRTKFASAVIAALAACAVVATAAAQSDAWPPDDPIAPAAERKVNAPPSVTLRERDDGRWNASFALSVPRAAERIVVAGSFNHWSRDATPLVRGADGIWRGDAVLSPGVHEYKFVLDGTTWLADPRNPDVVDDQNGGVNSVLRLGTLANLAESASAVGDGRVVADALGHDPGSVLYRRREADGSLVLRYRTLRDDVALVELLRRGESPLAMRPLVEVGIFQYWDATLSADAPLVDYTFRVRDGATVLRDPSIHSPAASSEPPSLRTPDWAKHAIWYQIMPDRFRNGSTSNDPERRSPWTSEWYEPQPWEAASGRGFYQFVFDRLYGGDLQGLREKLGYLKELGVNAIYLTPIFQSPSLHRYDATNYVHVEELLGVKGDYAAAAAKEDLLDPSTWTWTGSDKVFLEFLKDAKSMGFRVIIDGVWNHVGTAHPAFVDVREKGEASRFADWFSITSFEPFAYEGWAGFGGMPVFRKNEDGLASEAVKQHIFAVTRRWMDPDGDGDPSDGIDGWRLDVANEIALPFWTEWRQLVKSINPDAYLVGEIWKRADEYVDGRAFDAVMNYPFAEAVVAWIAHRDRKIPASEFDRRLAELRLAYPSEATYVLQNLLGSHDTDRVASMVLNPDRDYNRENRPQDGARGYDASRPPAWAYRRVRLMAFVQMTYVGAPMIWYGDEVGMWGANDPTNRKPMLWKDLEPYAKPEENKVYEAQLAWYRAITALRNAEPALRTGSFRTLLVDDAQDVWVFERELDGTRIIVAVNASEREATIDLAPFVGASPERWRERFSSAAAEPFARDERALDASFPRTTVPSVGGRAWVLRSSDGGAR